MNLPMPIEVEEDAQERPVSVTLPPSAAQVRPLSSPGRRTAGQRRDAPKGRTLKTASIDDLWQVDDEWWRETPISRRYFQITAGQITAGQITGQGERRLTIFQDRTTGQWYWQKGG